MCVCDRSNNLLDMLHYKACNIIILWEKWKDTCSKHWAYMHI